MTLLELIDAHATAIAEAHTAENLGDIEHWEREAFKLRAEVERRLKQLAEACRDGGNVMPVLVDAVKDYVSLGEISEVYRQVFGLYREPIIF